MKKRLTALILAAIMVAGCTFTAFGTETDETYEQDIMCEYFRSNYVIVICYNEDYTKIGSNANVKLECIDWNDEETTVEVGGGDIVQKVYEYEGKTYPQVFISIPTDKDIFEITSVQINEGAFTDDEGNQSKKVCYTLSETTRYVDFDVYCKGFEALGADGTLEVLTDSAVELSFETESAFAEVWADDIEFELTSESESLELNDNSGVLTKDGEYTALCRVNDVLFAEKNIKATGRTKAYFISLGDSFVNMVSAPFVLLYSLFYGIFVPGPGTLIGGLGVLGTLWSVPQFFIDLFTGPVTEILTF
ncbi:MAG: hypothetical protein IJB86_11305 [Clostridia bacterium]|nr:hypothetical protein [Clostridia bacterium]